MKCLRLKNYSKTKNKMRKISPRIIIFLLSGLLLTACMPSVSIRVLNPADITFPEEIRKVVVVNRTYPDEEGKVLNIIEGVLTGEGVGTDRRATEECIRGMIETMLQSPRFDLVRPSTTTLRGSGTGAFPETLSWEVVQRICEESGADALITLEAFDSDSRIAYRNVVVKEKQKDGRMMDVPYVDSDMRMIVTNGWRIYDYRNRRIIDEFRADDFLNFQGRGRVQQEALANLPQRFDALMRTGFHAGKQYGHRISPMWGRVTRSYYKKGNEDLKRAARYAERDKWEEAANIWRNLTKSQESKVAERASYNMAVFCEVEGRLDLAIEWANNTYQDYGLKRAKNYAATLRARMNRDKKAQEQMGSQPQEGQ
jgi:hypothetical protein